MDFKRCASKAKIEYGFPFVAECVGSSVFVGPCRDSQRPVPCGDGQCHSDYISCLRALVNVADTIADSSSVTPSTAIDENVLAHTIANAMRTHELAFNEVGRHG
jgi:hypothetical protein